MSKRCLIELFSEMGNHYKEYIEAEDGGHAFVIAQEMAAMHPNVRDFMTTEVHHEKNLTED